ncbi:MAG: hypothetical protein K2Y23_10915 [Cyanobacteria bacterium]|nr:hypothetical protein [Cyanobacteriota bacterium]
MWIRFVVIAASLAAAVPASAQSFDCAKAQTRIEKMVCADRSIADLDEYLGRYYAASRAEIPEAASCLQADQSQWLKTTRDVCADGTCLKTAYLTRLAELDPLQPGATALKNISLPVVPSLVWVVPPALDKVAAPPNPKARPYEAVGTLVDDIATNDRSKGISIRVKGGKDIPLVLTMFLEGKTQDRLAILAKEANATFRVKGFAATDPGGSIFFEPSRCAFVYRMPASQAKPKPVPQDPEQEMEQVRLKVVVQGKVCADPDRPCSGFKPNELSFSIASPFKFDRGRDKSQPFYAVILKSAPICSLADSERVRAQKVFPRAKVFLHRYFCEEFGDKVTYSNVNEKSGFVAVYAGDTEAAAQPILALAKASGYPDANIRRMEVIVQYQIE